MLLTEISRELAVARPSNSSQCRESLSSASGQIYPRLIESETPRANPSNPRKRCDVHRESASLSLSLSLNQAHILRNRRDLALRNGRREYRLIGYSCILFINYPRSRADSSALRPASRPTLRFKRHIISLETIRGLTRR